MLSKYQLKTADLYNISIGNIKRLVPNLFGKQKCVLHYENLQVYFKTRIKIFKKYMAY